MSPHLYGCRVTLCLSGGAANENISIGQMRNNVEKQYEGTWFEHPLVKYDYSGDYF